MLLLQKSIQGAVIILVIVMFRALLINKLPKKTFLILWAVAVFSLLCPFLPESKFSVYSLLGEKLDDVFYTADKNSSSTPGGFAIYGETGGDVMGEMGKEAAGSLTEEEKVKEKTGAGIGLEGENMFPQSEIEKNTGNAFPTALWMTLWLTGVVLCAGYFGIAYIRCRREFDASLPVDMSVDTPVGTPIGGKMAEGWLAAHRLKRKISIRQSGRILAPLTYGIFSPVILLPKGRKWEGEELSLCLEHEFVHIKRLDGVTKLVLTATLCLHWFNPMVWVMYVLANRDLELSCDEAVVRSFGENMKSVYARTLIHMEESKSTLMPLCNNFSKNAIEERITAIMKIKKLTLFTGITAAALVIGITLVFATSAAGKEDARADCVRELLGSEYSQEEREKLAAIWFEDYEDMTVADFQEKAWTMTDTPEYLDLIERFSNTAMEYERQEGRMEENRNAFWDYFYYVYEPLSAEAWRARDFGDYIRKDLATKERPYFPSADLEYFLTLSILEPKELTVKEYYDTRLGVKEDLQEFWQAKTAEDFSDEAGMRKAIEGEVQRIISKRSSEKLAVSIDYFYNSSDVYYSSLEEAEKKAEAGSQEADPYEEENERELRQYPYGTREDYASLLMLKTEDYESMSLEEFNERLLDWCNRNPEAMERTGTDAFGNDYQVELTEEEKKFAALTVQLSRFENNEWVISLNTGKPEEDPRWGGKKYMDSEGNMWCSLYFQFSYHISDKSRVTVGERDRCIEGMMEQILRFWEETELEERIKLSEEEVAGKFETWAEECSSRLVTIKIDREQIQYEHMDEREYAAERVYLGTVSAQGSLRNYISAGEEGKESKYFHLTVANHTEKEISGLTYAMLAYDSKGRPLEVYWNFMDSSKPASYECTVTKRSRILPGDTLDDAGGWSIMESPWGVIDLTGYGTDYKVEYVLSCIKQIIFEDGTQWDNPGYEKWREECCGKTVPYSVFGEYSQQEYEIYGYEMEG